MITGNNPGNIRRVQGQTWQGETVPSPWVAGFVTFSSLDYGFRALIKLLSNYVQNGYNTITKIISRYAPPFENNTQAYISFVSSYSGIPPDAPLPADAQTLKIIAAAIAENEHSGKLSPDDLAALRRGAAMIDTGPADQAQTASFGPLLLILLILFSPSVIRSMRG